MREMQGSLNSWAGVDCGHGGREGPEIPNPNPNNPYPKET